MKDCCLNPWDRKSICWKRGHKVFRENHLSTFKRWINGCALRLVHKHIDHSSTLRKNRLKPTNENPIFKKILRPQPIYLPICWEMDAHQSKSHKILASSSSLHSKDISIPQIYWQWGHIKTFTNDIPLTSNLY